MISFLCGGPETCWSRSGKVRLAGGRLPPAGLSPECCVTLLQILSHRHWPKSLQKSYPRYRITTVIQLDAMFSASCLRFGALLVATDSLLVLATSSRMHALACMMARVCSRSLKPMEKLASLFTYPYQEVQRVTPPCRTTCSVWCRNVMSHFLGSWRHACTSKGAAYVGNAFQRLVGKE